MKMLSFVLVVLLSTSRCYAMDENSKHLQLVKHNSQNEILDAPRNQPHAPSQEQIQKQLEDLKKETEKAYKLSTTLQKKVKSLEDQQDLKDNLPLINGGIIAFAYVLILGILVIKK